MSRIMSVKCTCSICGATNEYNVLASTNTFGGGPDLDLRPAEMMRSTMNTWIQECPECGYISDKVSDTSVVTIEWLRSERYLTCDGIIFESDLAKRFYKYYMINMEDNNAEDAFFAVLHAAWACDDIRDEENACRCRMLAIPLADRLIDNNHKRKNDILLMRADIMRRAGRFEDLIKTYSGVRFDIDLLNQLLKFEIEKARNKDLSCYCVSDVTGK